MPLPLPAFQTELRSSLHSSIWFSEKMPPELSEEISSWTMMNKSKLSRTSLLHLDSAVQLPLLSGFLRLVQMVLNPDQQSTTSPGPTLALGPSNLRLTLYSTTMFPFALITTLGHAGIHSLLQAVVILSLVKTTHMCATDGFRPKILIASLDTLESTIPECDFSGSFRFHLNILVFIITVVLSLSLTLFKFNLYYFHLQFILFFLCSAKLYSIYLKFTKFSLLWLYLRF